MSTVAAAAVTLVYLSPSTVTTGVAPPPVIFQAGPDSTTGTYVSGWSLSSNATSFSVTLNGVPEMRLVADDLFRVKNQDAISRSVTITTAQVTSSAITVYTIQFFNGATPMGTLDLKAGSPSVSLSGIAAGATYTAKVTLEMASGAGNNNAATTSTMTMTLG